MNFVLLMTTHGLSTSVCIYIYTYTEQFFHKNIADFFLRYISKTMGNRSGTLTKVNDREALGSSPRTAFSGIELNKSCWEEIIRRANMSTNWSPNLECHNSWYQLTKKREIKREITVKGYITCRSIAFPTEKSKAACCVSQFLISFSQPLNRLPARRFASPSWPADSSPWW